MIPYADSFSHVKRNQENLAVMPYADNMLPIKLQIWHSYAPVHLIPVAQVTEGFGQ